MATNPLPSQEVLRQLLRYEPETGKLFWRERDVSWFEDGDWNPARRKAAIWNGKNSGREALAGINTSGYASGRILSRTVLSHRVVWKLATAEDPEFIDHVNGRRADNRIENLRSVSKRENSLNQRPPKHSTSGVLGVSWHRRTGKWAAKIGVNGQTLHLGYFSTIEDAAAARLQANKRFGFHRNHGK